jgi:lysophospholipase L1-like esterase
MRIQDAQLIDRLDSAIESPLVISLLVGTNDLQRGNPKGSDSVASEFNAEYLDLWPVLATPERSLKSELTFDNLHLNAKGYRHWVEIPAPALEQVTTKD